MKVSELEGAQLDYRVAKAEGIELCGEMPPRLAGSWDRHICDYESYSPSTDWAIGGPLIDKYRNSPAYDERTEDWFVIYEVNFKKKEFREIHGKTSLIAFCRYIVASKFGEEVDDTEIK